MDTTAMHLARVFAEKLEDAGHCTQSARTLTVDSRDEVLDIAVWDATCDDAWDNALCMLQPLAGDDTGGFQVHTHREKAHLVANVFWYGRSVYTLKMTRDELDGNLDVVKESSLRSITHEKFAARLRDILSS